MSKILESLIIIYVFNQTAGGRMLSWKIEKGEKVKPLYPATWHNSSSSGLQLGFF